MDCSHSDLRTSCRAVSAHSTAKETTLAPAAPRPRPATNRRPPDAKRPLDAPTPEHGSEQMTKCTRRPGSDAGTQCQGGSATGSHPVRVSLLTPRCQHRRCLPWPWIPASCRNDAMHPSSRQPIAPPSRPGCRDPVPGRAHRGSPEGWRSSLGGSPRAATPPGSARRQAPARHA